MPDKAHIDWELAGFVERGTLDAFGARHPIWRPPAITVESRPPWAHLRYGERPTPTLVYPVPDGWGPFVVGADMRELTASGWEVLDDTAGVLEDFVQLAREQVDPHTLDSDTVEAVHAFAKKWGPLWRCASGWHWDCHWPSYSVIVHHMYHARSDPWDPTHMEGDPSPLCSWVPEEEVLEFVRKATEAKAVLDVAALIWEHKTVPAAVPGLGGLEWSPKDRRSGSPQARYVVQSTINNYLWPLSGPRLWLTWDPSNSPSLELESGRGFIHAVWMKIAQILCGAKGIYQCDGCGQLYVRGGRKPQAGRRNYCPDCGKDAHYKASKRESWARYARKNA